MSVFLLFVLLLLLRVGVKKVVFGEYGVDPTDEKSLSLIYDYFG